MHRLKSSVDNIDYLKLSQSEGKARKISQPVKIAQLLGFSGQSQSAKKNSAVKISQPERITPYLKNASTQKKNRICIVNRLHNGENNVRRNLNFAEMPTATKKTPRNARVSGKSNNEDQRAANEGGRSARSSCGGRRTSFLLPPNTIKDMYLRSRFKESRSMLPNLNQTRLVMAESVNKCPRISEGSETCSPVLAETGNTPNARAARRCENNKTSVIQYTSSRTHNVNNQSGISDLRSFGSDLTDATARKEVAERSNPDDDSGVNSSGGGGGGDGDDEVTIIDCKRQQLSLARDARTDDTKTVHNGSYLDSEASTTFSLSSAEKPKRREETRSAKAEVSSLEEKRLFASEDRGKDFRVSLQDVKTTSELVANVRHGTNEEDGERVSLSKRELAVLASKLRHLICRLEEDVSYLRLILISVTSLLSADATSKTVGDDNETESKRRTNGNSNGEVANSTNASATTVTVEHEGDNVPIGIRKMLRFDLLSEIDVPEIQMDKVVETQPSRPVEFDGNKENENENSHTPIRTDAKAFREEPKSETRRRSARLMAKALKNSSAANDSFVNLENELRIANVTFDPTTPIPSRKADRTPLTNKCKKSGERPWKEYMALKSRMSCLLTPNAKRFDSSLSENGVQAGGAKASLSNKIFAELHNLYSDSPDMQ